MRAPLFAAALLAGLAVSLGPACSTDSTPDEPEVPTREVVLPDGSTLRVPERAVRILPMSSAAVDYVVSLVDRERVVAVPVEAPIYATSLIRGAPWPEDRTVPEFSAEAMLARDPDLVIAHRWQTPVEALDAVESSGVPVLRLDDETSFEDILLAVQLVASAIDEPRAGAHLAHELQQRVDALQANAGRRAELSALSYTNYGSGGWSAGLGTTADVLIELTGMRNAGAEDERTGHYQIDIERLLVLDPDVLLMSRGNDEYSPGRAYIEDEDALQSLSAVERGWIVELPWDLFGANSHYLVEAAEVLAASVDALQGEDE